MIDNRHLPPLCSILDHFDTLQVACKAIALEVRIPRCAREGDDIADIFKAGEIHHHSFQSQTEAGVGDGPVPAQVEEPQAEVKPTKENTRRGAAERRVQLKPLRDKVTAAESQIATLNAELAKLDKALSDPLLFTKDPAKGSAVSKKRADAARKLEAAEKAWVAASEAHEMANA